MKVGTQTVQAATNYEPRDYLLNRTRQSYVGTLDYRLRARRRTSSFRANVNDFTDNEDRRRTRFRPGTYQPGDSATASRIERGLRYRKLNDQIQDYTLKAEHTASNYAVDAIGGWSQARETNPYREEVTFRQSNVTLQYDNTDPYNPALALSKGNLDQANLYTFNALTQNFRDAKDRDLTGTSEPHGAVPDRLVGRLAQVRRRVSRQGEEFDGSRHRDDEVSRRRSRSTR